MYKKLGYSVYRQVLEYYTGDPDEDAYGNINYFVASLEPLNGLLFFLNFLRHAKSITSRQR